MLIEENVDIGKMPATIPKGPGDTITLGDMHGNTMKLISCLKHEGVIDMTDAQYKDLLEIYNAGWTGEMTGGVHPPGEIFSTEGAAKKSAEKFNAILAKITFKPGYNIRLLGDVIADRGNNDWLTLMLLKKMHESGIRTQITASNHDLFFLSAYKKSIDDPLLQGSESGYYLRQYMSKFFPLIKSGVMTRRELESVIEQHYLPGFVPLSYALSEDKQEITLFMHSPNTLGVVKELAGDLGVTYNGETAVDLAKTIDEINTAFQKLSVVDRAKFDQMILDAYDSDREPKTALGQLVWNYGINQSGKLDSSSLPSYVTKVVHGHVGERDISTLDERQTNLDTDWGKVDTISLHLHYADKNYT